MSINTIHGSELRYGSDQSGLIYGYLFSPNQPGHNLTSEEAEQWLAQLKNNNKHEFIWLHFNLNNVGSEKWLLKHVDLSEIFYEMLHEGARSTSIEYADNALIGIINDVLYNAVIDDSNVSTMWLSVDKHMVISARFKPLQSIEKLRTSVKENEIFRSSVELLIHLLRDQADVMVDILRHTTADIDRIEDDILAKRIDKTHIDLGVKRRILVRLQRLLAPEPAAMFRLLNRPPLWITKEDIQNFRHSTEEFAAVLSDMGALIERIKLLQEEVTASVNEETNRSLFLLTTVTVLALPINIIAGLLGMNVGGIPLANHEHGFLIITSIIITFTLIAIWLVFIKKRTN